MSVRATADELRPKFEAGRQAPLLICAYDDEAKCRDVGVPSALTYPQFKQQESSVDKNRELVFFCA